MSKSKAFTLIELLIVFAIMAILIIMGWFAWRTQINKAHDAQRKEHLQRLSVAFEDYYNDHDCYPSSGIINTCGGDTLQPYLQDIPCDPVYNTPYCYIHDPDNLECGQNFKILSPLENAADPIIQKLLCHGQAGCGYNPVCQTDTGNSASFNYGTGSGNVPILNPLVSPPPVPSSPPSSPSTPPGTYSGPGQFGCQDQICNNYGTPENAAAACTYTFVDSQCDHLCSTSPYQGSCY